MALSPDPSGLSSRAGAGWGNAICVASMITWAAGFPAAEALLTAWDPLPLITARLLMAVAVLVPIWMLVEGASVLWRARWGWGSVVGGLGFGLGTYLILVGQALTDPVTVAIVAAASPIFATLIEWVMEHRRPHPMYLVGLALSVFGGVIAVGQLGGAGLGWGAAAAIASVVLFAWGSHMAVRDFPELSPLGRTTVTLGGGLMFMGTLFLGSYGLGYSALPEVVFDAWTISNLALYAAGAMALSQLLWISAVGRLGVAAASFHINIAPFYVMLILLALGAGWSWPQAVGAAVVAAGVVVAQRGGSWRRA